VRLPVEAGVLVIDAAAAVAVGRHHHPPRHPPAADPAQAVRFHDHEDGLATHEDLIGHGLTHARSAVLVQNLQQRRGALGSGLGPAAEFRNAGGALAEDNLQKTTGDRQTDAGGLGGGGELSLAIVVEDNGAIKASLPVGPPRLGLFELLAEAEDFLAVSLCVEISADGVGLSVDGLSAESVFLGDACDGAIASEECSGGAGDALGKG
jgi:hypothetical protein